MPRRSKPCRRRRRCRRGDARGAAVSGVLPRLLTSVAVLASHSTFALDASLLVSRYGLKMSEIDRILLSEIGDDFGTPLTADEARELWTDAAEWRWTIAAAGANGGDEPGVSYDLHPFVVCETTPDLSGNQRRFRLDEHSAALGDALPDIMRDDAPPSIYNVKPDRTCWLVSADANALGVALEDLAGGADESELSSVRVHPVGPSLKTMGGAVEAVRRWIDGVKAGGKEGGVEISGVDQDGMGGFVEEEIVDEEIIDEEIIDEDVIDEGWLIVEEEGIDGMGGGFVDEEIVEEGIGFIDGEDSIDEGGFIGGEDVAVAARASGVSPAVYGGAGGVGGAGKDVSQLRLDVSLCPSVSSRYPPETIASNMVSFLTDVDGEAVVSTSFSFYETMGGFGLSATSDRMDFWSDRINGALTNEEECFASLWESMTVDLSDAMYGSARVYLPPAPPSIGGNGDGVARWEDCVWYTFRGLALHPFVCRLDYFGGVTILPVDNEGGEVIGSGATPGEDEQASSTDPTTGVGDEATVVTDPTPSRAAVGTESAQGVSNTTRPASPASDESLSSSNGEANRGDDVEASSQEGGNEQQPSDGDAEDLRARDADSGTTKANGLGLPGIWAVVVILLTFWVIYV